MAFQFEPRHADSRKKAANVRSNDRISVARTLSQQVLTPTAHHTMRIILRTVEAASFTVGCHGMCRQMRAFSVKAVFSAEG